MYVRALNERLVNVVAKHSPIKPLFIMRGIRGINYSDDTMVILFCFKYYIPLTFEICLFEKFCVEGEGKCSPFSSFVFSQIRFELFYPLCEWIIIFFDKKFIMFRSMHFLRLVCSSSITTHIYRYRFGTSLRRKREKKNVFEIKNRKNLQLIDFKTFLKHSV